MRYQYTHFIKQNIAPPGTRRIVVYDGNGKEVTGIVLGSLAPPSGEPFYSFGLIGDIHIGSSGHDGYLNDALTLFENHGCKFCTHAGDITNIGFWYSSTDTEIYLSQMAGYKAVVDKHPNLPVYGICGNHESYNKAIMENLEELVEYTGTPLYYTMTSGAAVNPTTNGGNIHNANVGEDVFIFIGQPSGTPSAFSGAYKSVWVAELDWLEATLEANKDRRCFVYEHLTLTDDAGNPNNIHNAYWGDLESRLFSILSSYKNAIVFHGHSHLDLGEQPNFSYANYTEKNGFKSVHAGAPCGGRITIDGVLQKSSGAPGVNGCGAPEKRCGYVVDVYACHIVLRGYYFATGEIIPIATYKIDTALYA